MTTPSRKVVRFDTPRHVSQAKDQFGCVGFTSYGTVTEAGRTVHVRNPDFNWRAARMGASLSL